MSSLPEMFDPYASLHRADSYRPAPRGYYIVRSFLVWGGVFGVLVGLYRNDVLRDLSRKIGQEKRYLAAESLLVGSPGWGTPRSMEPVLGGGAVAAPAPSPEPAAAAPAAPAAETPAAPAAAAAPAPAPQPVAAAPAPASPGLVPVPLSALPADPLKPVSLDSLPAESNAPRAASVEAAAPRAASPSAPAAAPRPAANTKASKIALDDGPAPKVATAPPKPAEPSRPKATEARATDNPLTAAIRGAVRARPASDAVPQ